MERFVFGAHQFVIQSPDCKGLRRQWVCIICQDGPGERKENWPEEAKPLESLLSTNKLALQPLSPQLSPGPKYCWDLPDWVTPGVEPHIMPGSTGAVLAGFLSSFLCVVGLKRWIRNGNSRRKEDFDLMDVRKSLTNQWRRLTRLKLDYKTLRAQSSDNWA